MSVAISVGPPMLTINQGSTFMVTAPDGEIAADSEQGAFASDTRFVSYYEISANGTRWDLLTSSATTYYAARAYLANRPFESEDGDVPARALGLTIRRSVAEGIHEDLDITNYSAMEVRFNLEIALRSDFADIFEVKTRHFVRRGHISTSWDAGSLELRNMYRNQDFSRALTYRFVNNSSKPSCANGRLTFEVNLPPGASWHTCGLYIFELGGVAREPLRTCHEEDQTGLDRHQRDWEREATKLDSSKEDQYRLFKQSVEDMGALRLHEHDPVGGSWLPAAGVPWFVTIFGRDSLIASLQTMMVNPRLSLGALRKLAELQATEVDDWRDAEPGKIPHEIRFGELAHVKRVPHTPYYGTADATILYLIVLHETWKWLGDDALLEAHVETAERCLAWIDAFGDLDGDGFQEYQTRSSNGYENMGWKDARDAIVYADGTQVPQPKAVCELQGYVFDAWLRMAEVFAHRGDGVRAADLRRKAAELQERFERLFWCEEEGIYALSLDPGKRPSTAIASNAGHLLWSGIASPEHAERVVRRLMARDMSSGWGIRTLSSGNPAYNPFSYQRGSVWPHDNAIIASGFSRYGFHDEASCIARDISQAASYFVSYRLPELYSGMEREEGSFPVQYPGANVPQAWAAGATFQLMQTMLGLRADAPNRTLFVDPHVPGWLGDATLRGLHVGDAIVDLTFALDGTNSRWDATVTSGDLKVVQQAWTPWSVPNSRVADR